MKTFRILVAVMLAWVSLLTTACSPGNAKTSVESTPTTSDQAEAKDAKARPEAESWDPEKAKEKATADEAAAKESNRNDAKVEQDESPRIVVVNGGSHKLNIEQWPLIGPADATYVMVAMFDYACPHCRTTDKAIREACTALGNDVAIIAMPVPLNANCNETVKRTGKGFEESCETAKLAVACWRVDPESFQQFHERLFAADTVPTYAAAKQIADDLVGKEKIDAELSQPFADRYIRKHVSLYKNSGAGPLPRLMFKTANVVGEVSSTDAMTEIIRDKALQE
ncbi:MAG: hypothetical protein ACR2NP_01800 [Pirellulaceae bacterium]